jgi:hypothetical protein
LLDSRNRLYATSDRDNHYGPAHNRNPTDNDNDDPHDRVTGVLMKCVIQRQQLADIGAEVSFSNTRIDRKFANNEVKGETR